MVEFAAKTPRLPISQAKFKHAFKSLAPLSWRSTNDNPLKWERTGDDRPRCIGTSADGLVACELEGKPKHIQRFSLLCALPMHGDATTIATRNAALLQIAIQLLLPQWQGRTEWLLQAVNRAREQQRTQCATESVKLVMSGQLLASEATVNLMISLDAFTPERYQEWLQKEARVAGAWN